jgi:hypothetical protein
VVLEKWGIIVGVDKKSKQWDRSCLTIGRSWRPGFGSGFRYRRASSSFQQ